MGIISGASGWDCLQCCNNRSRFPATSPAGVIIALCRCSADVLGARAFWSLTDLEVDRITFSEIVDSFALHRALVEEILLPGRVLDKTKTLVAT